jgi:tetratricopeptide (TPR) repeat protein
MHSNLKTAQGRDRARRSRRRDGAERSAPEAAVDAALNHAIEHLKTDRIAAALACVGPLAHGNERRPERANLAGLIYLAAGESQSALVWFDRAIALEPGCAQAWSNRGTALYGLDRAGALAAFDEALRLGLEEPALYFHRGNLLRAAGRLDEAIAAYDAALRLNPAYPQALRAGALVLRDLGHSDGALEFLDEAVRLDPLFRDAHTDRGDLLQSLERLEEAIAAYDRALAGDLANPAALNNRGAALLTLTRYAEADAAFDAAIRADPGAPQAWNNRGNLMMATQRPADAIACYERALALRADYLEALIGRALAKKQLGCFDEALAGLDAALALEPHSDHARNNKAVLLLQRGDFEAGWDLYESRWILNRTAKRALKLPVPEWEGQALEGQSIIVFDEQGLGDAIQFIRFCLELADLGADVAVFCRKRLHRLFSALSPRVRFVDDIAPGAHFDYQIALCSLPRALRIRADAIPARTPYLRPEPPLVEKWAARLGPDGLKVGVCWRGSGNLKADPGRALPRADFEALAMDGVRLISLQKPGDLPAEDRAGAPWLERMGEDFDAGADAFVDTAALMASLDLIVTCDTSIAHLAGALGRPVFVLLQQVADWRWLLDREDCPWYPAMRLIRQSARGDWSGPISRVAAALKELSPAAAPPECN